MTTTAEQRRALNNPMDPSQPLIMSSGLDLRRFLSETVMQPQYTLLPDVSVDFFPGGFTLKGGIKGDVTFTLDADLHAVSPCGAFALAYNPEVWKLLACVQPMQEDPYHGASVGLDDAARAVEARIFTSTRSPLSFGGGMVRIFPIRLEWPDGSFLAGDMADFTLNLGGIVVGQRRSLYSSEELALQDCTDEDLEDYGVSRIDPEDIVDDVWPVRTHTIRALKARLAAGKLTFPRETAPKETWPEVAVPGQVPSQWWNRTERGGVSAAEARLILAHANDLYDRPGPGLRPYPEHERPAPIPAQGVLSTGQEPLPF